MYIIGMSKKSGVMGIFYVLVDILFFVLNAMNTKP